MTTGTSTRTAVRKIIERYGKNVSQYKYSEATITTADEGDETIVWGSANTIIGTSSRNVLYVKDQQPQGIASSADNRILIVKDTETVARRDKIVIGDETYEVAEIKNIDPIETNVIIAKRLALKRHEGY